MCECVFGQLLENNYVVSNPGAISAACYDLLLFVLCRRHRGVSELEHHFRLDVVKKPRHATCNLKVITALTEDYKVLGNSHERRRTIT